MHSCPVAWRRWRRRVVDVLVEDHAAARNRGSRAHRSGSRAATAAATSRTEGDGVARGRCRRSAVRAAVSCHRRRHTNAGNRYGHVHIGLSRAAIVRHCRLRLCRTRRGSNTDPWLYFVHGLRQTFPLRRSAGQFVMTRATAGVRRDAAGIGYLHANRIVDGIHIADVVPIRAAGVEVPFEQGRVRLAGGAGALQAGPAAGAGRALRRTGRVTTGAAPSGRCSHPARWKETWAPAASTNRRSNRWKPGRYRIHRVNRSCS